MTDRSYDPSLPKHAADKVKRALDDVLTLASDSGEMLRIALMAASIPIGAAGGILAAQMRAEGHECSQQQAMERLFKLLEMACTQGADAAWSSLQSQRS